MICTHGYLKGFEKQCHTCYPEQNEDNSKESIKTNCDNCNTLRAELEKLHRLVPIGTYSINIVHEQEILRLHEELNKLKKDRDLVKAQLENVLDSKAEGMWMARALDAERAFEDIKDQVYIGDHHFSDLTWKSRALEHHEDLKIARLRLEEISELVGPGGDDTPFGRVESAIMNLSLQRDAAREKAKIYEKNWYEAKSEFGTAAGKLRESLRNSQKAELETMSLLNEEKANNRELRALIREAYMELSTIEAITVSPSDIDQLMNLCGRLYEASKESEKAPNEAENLLSELLVWADNWLPDEAKDQGARELINQCKKHLS